MTKDTRARFTIRIPVKMFSDLKQHAKDGGTSTNAMILKILQEYIKKEKL